MKKRLKSVDPLQAGKMLGVLYAAMGLIFIPFILLFSLVGALVPELQGGGNSDVSIGMGVAVGIGLGMAVLMPALYGVMGFVSGIVSALVYNLVAKWIGGIQFELEDVEV